MLVGIDREGSHHAATGVSIKVEADKEDTSSQQTRFRETVHLLEVQSFDRFVHVMVHTGSPCMLRDRVSVVMRPVRKNAVGWLTSGLILAT
jgi:hypothetical protein